MMSYKKILIIPVVLLASLAFLSAKELPKKAQKKILSKFPELDANADGKLSIFEYKSGSSSLPAEARKKIDKMFFRGQSKRDQSNGGTSGDRLARAANFLAETGLKGEQDIVYKASPENETVFDIIYPRKKTTEKGPVFIYIHGGGYTGGTRNGIYTKHQDVIVPLCEAGITVVTIDYRVGGVQKPVSMNHINQDCKDALRYLAKNAARFGIDPHKMVTWGTSAGGSLALITALTDSGFLPGAVTGKDTLHTVVGSVVFYGGTSFDPDAGVWKARTTEKKKDYLWHPNNGLNREDMIELVSPDKHFTKNSPPLLLFHGDNDKAVPVESSRYLNNLAKKIGAEVTYFEIKNADHGFRPASGTPSMTEQEIKEILVKHVLKWFKNS